MGTIELVCPAGTPAMLRAAIEAGADSVYCGMRDDTNARNFPGLNFSCEELARSTTWAHERQAKVLVAINTFARAGDFGPWMRAVDAAVEAGADAIIAADLAVLAYARQTHPHQRLHLSVQAAASSAESIAFYVKTYGVKRVVLPRVLSAVEIAALRRASPAEIEAFVFGGLCVMAEGRCALSSYYTGRSPNLNGVCSPPEAVTFDNRGEEMIPRLAGLAVDHLAPGEATGYPTLCKGRFQAEGEESYLFEDPTSLNAMSLLQSLRSAGVTAVKIEGRQRGKAYVARVTAAFRGAIDAMDRGQDTSRFEGALSDLTEGGRETAGAYGRKWK